MSMYNGIELELERLKAEKPEIEAEKARILNAIDNAPHMSLAIKNEIRAMYRNRLENVQEDISNIGEHLKSFREDDGHGGRR